jgi:hypothetical protein
LSVQFDWHVGFDQEEETLARIGRRQRRRWPWWGWAILGVLLVTIATGGVLFVRRRYREAEERVKFQIQSVIDLEARAYARRDRSLFMEQQDSKATDWFRAQYARIGQDCDDTMPTAPLLLPDEHDYRPPRQCRPVLPAKVDAIDVQGDVAWVEVIEDDPPVRRARFYRRTDLGWKHTAPRVEFWGAPVELTYGDLVFRYHRRDQPHVDALVEHISATFFEVCATLSCSPERLPEINFVAQSTMPLFSPHQGHVLVLSSPWLSGIPAGEEWDRETIERLTYAAAYDVASESLRSLTNRGLNRTQAALIDEYAIWQATGDAAQAPVIGRVVERYGREGLREIVLSLQDSDTLNLFLADWLGISASKEPVRYFQTLLDLERDALRAGRRRTFLLLQDDSEDGWMARRERFFRLVQADALSLSPATVQTVGISADLARVTLESATTTPPGQTSLDGEQTVFFRRRDGDWKRTAPVEELAGEIKVAGTESRPHIQVALAAFSSHLSEPHTGMVPPHTPDEKP